MDNRCTSMAKSTRKRCKLPAIPGGTVCEIHGGGAPQVIESARHRLNKLVNPAIKGLDKSLKCDDPATVTRTATVILDRTGFHPSQKVLLEVEGLTKFLADLVRVKPDLAEGIAEACAILAAEKERDEPG